MEVKIGITDSPRELVLTSAQSPVEVEKIVSAAMADNSGTLALEDDKGRRFLVQAAKIAYVEIGSASRPVGFSG